MKSKKNGYSALLFCFFLVVAGITLLPLALLAVASFRPGDGADAERAEF